MFSSGITEDSSHFGGDAVSDWVGAIRCHRVSEWEPFGDTVSMSEWEPFSDAMSVSEWEPLGDTVSHPSRTLQKQFDVD